MSALASVPVEQRAAAARRVILSTASLDEHGREAILALGLWPDDDDTPEPEPEPEPGPVAGRTCADCGPPFTCPRPSQRFCSRSCATRTWHRARRAAQV